MLLHSKFAMVCAMYPLLCGFVFISGSKPRIERTQSPVDGVMEATFVWDGSAPKKIVKKDELDGGIYADFTEEDLMEAILFKAAGIWSGIPAANLRLIVTKGPASLDREDLQNSIIVDSNISITTAASASPSAPDTEPYAGKVINDCDIRIAQGQAEAKSLLNTVVHELGHCLGFGHPHQNTNSIMSYQRVSNSPDLAADDIAGLVYLYGGGEEAVKEHVTCGVVHSGRNVAPLGMLLLVLLLMPAFARKRTTIP